MRYFFFLLVPFFSCFSMTLEQSVRLALEYNKDLRKSELSIKRYESVRESVRSESYGQVDLLASFDKYNLPRTLAPLTPTAIFAKGPDTIPTSENIFTTGVNYKVNLFDGFAEQSAYKISDLQYKNAGLINILSREELIYNVRDLYLTLLSLNEQLKAQEAYVKIQKRMLTRVETKYKLGSKAKLDVLKIKSTLSEAKVTQATTKSNINILKSSLCTLMGGEEIDYVEPIDIDVQEEMPLFDEQINVHTLQRYKVSELEMKINKQKQRKTHSSYFPKLDFNAYYGQTYGPNDSTTYNQKTNEETLEKGEWNNQEVWQIGLNLKWNILDFGASSSKDEEGELAYLNASLQKDKVVLQLNESMVKAKSNIELSIAQFKSFLAQYELLQETEKIEKIKYDNAALSLTDFLETRSKKELAFSQMINAKYTYQKALYYLEYLLEKGEKN